MANKKLNYTADEINQLLAKINENSLTLGEYTIQYNAENDSLDFVYNGTTVIPTYNYITDGLDIYINANNLGDSNTTISDLSGNNKVITLMNGMTKTLSTDNCLQMNASASNYLAIDYIPPLDKFTIEVYGYFNGDAQNSICSWGTSGNRITLATWESENIIMAMQNDTPNTVTSRSNFLSLAHLVVTYENGTAKSFLNGTLANTFSASNLSIYTNSFKIGTKYSATEEFSDLRLRQFRFYNKALTTEEVLNNYNFCIN